VTAHEHSCQRSDDAEATLRNLAIFGWLSGSNRARLGFPLRWRIQALRLRGENVTAALLTDEIARETARRYRAVEIPHQRGAPEMGLADQVRRAGHPDNNRGGR
jgi:hypothetical protein